MAATSTKFDHITEILSMVNILSEASMFSLVGMLLAPGATVANVSSRGPVMYGDIEFPSVRDALLFVSQTIRNNLEALGGEKNAVHSFTKGAGTIQWGVTYPGYCTLFTIVSN